jgi:hypothetical protein
MPTSDDFPFVLDCATSINQRGKIEKYARLGHDTPKVHISLYFSYTSVLNNDETALWPFYLGNGD